MITKTYEGHDEWLAARRGKITGSRLKDIVSKSGSNRKIGFYELVAERLGVPGDGESPMDRGTRLEEEAMARFEFETGHKVNTDLVIWSREDNPNIAISPDGFIDREQAVETKCLSSARHIEAFVTQKVPSDYWMQALQYFIVNDDLQTLYFVFYDPRILVKDFFYLTVKREDVEEEIEIYLNYQKKTMEEVNQIVNELTF